MKHARHKHQSSSQSIPRNMALPFKAVAIPPPPPTIAFYNSQQDTSIKSYALTLNRSHLIVKLLSFMSGCEETML